MKDKALAVMQKIIHEGDKIEGIVKNGEEYYFKFGNHFFSILKREEGESLGYYGFYIYPRWKKTLEELPAAFSTFPFDDEMASYNQSDYAAKHDKDVFRELYLLMVNKYLNIDKIFDDILGS